MSIVKEFRDFAMRGNVVDLAVGVIIGGAFGKIVNSMVNDILMPPVGLMMGGVKFTDIVVTLKEAVMEGDKVVAPAVNLNVGNFLQTTVEFVIVAFAIFLMIKAMNSLKKKEAAAPAPPPAPPAPSAEQKLLAEIRDLLAKKA